MVGVTEQSIQQRITAILTEHTPTTMRFQNPHRHGLYENRPACQGCDWTCDRSVEAAAAHRAHVAGVLVEALGLTEEQRQLADGYGGISTNWKTGKTTVHSRPCTVESRWVTPWAAADG